MKRTPPRTGDLKDKITLCIQVNQPDGHGGVLSEDQEYWHTYAEVLPLKSSSRLEVNQEVLKQVYRVTVRYRPDKEATKDMPVYWKGKRHTITALQADLTDKDWVVFDMVAAA